MVVLGKMELAKQYAEAGLTLIPLKGKIPVQKNWTKAEYVFQDKVEETFGDWKDNLGIKIGKYLLVIDVDPRNFSAGDNPLKRLFEDCEIEDPYADFAVVQTGGGGFHFYANIPNGFWTGFNIKEKQEKYQGIEFKTLGRQVVAAGSIHPDTNAEYKLLPKGRKLNDLTLAPKQLFKVIAAKKSKIKTNFEHDSYQGSTDDSLDILAKYKEILLNFPPATQGNGGDDRTYMAAAKGRDLGLSNDKIFEMLLLHYNPRCEPPWSDNELRGKVNNVSKYAKGVRGAALPQTHFKKILDGVEKTVYHLFKAWDRTEEGKLKPTRNNIQNFFLMTETPLWQSVRWNEMSGEVTIMKPLPWWSQFRDVGKYGTEWRDSDTSEFCLWLSREHRMEIGAQKIYEVLSSVGKMFPFHPVLDYLDNLVWDGKPRLDTWTVDYLGAKDTDVNRAIGTKMLLQAVMRIKEPGCKADGMLVLEGPQGAGKTKVVKVLGGDFYGDVPLDLNNRRDTIVACGKHWIIEQSEMITTRKFDAGKLKSFLTSDSDTYRAAYGHKTSTHDRHFVFIGTTNLDGTGEYLDDPTGNRRYFPIKCGKIDEKGLAVQRDQIFAEAVQRAKFEPHYFENHDPVYQKIIKEQAKRQMSHPWEELVEEYLEEKKPYFVTLKQVWVYAVKGQEASLNPNHKRVLSNILSVLGYEKNSVWDEGRTKRGWTNKQYKHTWKKEDGEVL